MSFKDHMTAKNIIAIILLIIGIVWLIHEFYVNWRVNRISSWPKVNATVISAVAEPVNPAAGNVVIEPKYVVATTDSHARYHPHITYRYRVGERDYTSTNIVYHDSKIYTALEVKTLLGKITPGMTIPVYYNPEHPDEAYIYYGHPSYWGILLSVILILVALYLLYHHARTNKIASSDSYPEFAKVETPVNAPIPTAFQPRYTAFY